uniref:Uncharacterized protein n=1 Tax=Paracidobacterium acidisoli TaxID=2303751 RepID=A0A372IJS2_9BACT
MGNADCCRIDLDNGDQILIDYAAMRDPACKDDLRIDLPSELRKDLDSCKRDSYKVVMFTHLDDDHIRGTSNFFYLRHAQKYQGQVDGKSRIKMDEMWVPAAVITEEGCTEEDRIIRQEARYRLKEGTGIRVFSRPEELKNWLEGEGLSVADRRSLITDAGQLVPGWLAEIQGVEFFVHSPFACRTDDGSYVERNDGCLVLHATFSADGTKTRVFFGADIRQEPLSEIVRITRSKNREERLESDIVKIPHHSSYLSLGPDKGTTKTKPTEDIAYFYEKKLLWRATLISTSKPIPTNDDDPQPPHRQAANYYREQADAQGGTYIVTMENPKASSPETLVIEITGSKAKQKKSYSAGLVSAVSQPAPRAGNGD